MFHIPKRGTPSNPITVTDGYNDRLQPVLLSATTPSATIMSLCYDFHLHVVVSVAPCSFSASSAGDNGNVFQIVNNRDGAWSNLTNRGQVSGRTNYEALNCPAYRSSSPHAVSRFLRFAGQSSEIGVQILRSIGVPNVNACGCLGD